MFTFEVSGDMSAASASTEYLKERLKGLRCPDHSDSHLQLECSCTSDSFQVDKISACCDHFHKTVTDTLRGVA